MCLPLAQSAHKGLPLCARRHAPHAPAPSLPTPLARHSSPAATFGVKDVAALRKALDIAPVDKAFAFLPLAADSGCAARCAALKAKGQAEPMPAAEAATNFSLSISGMQPQLDSELGSFRTVTAGGWWGGWAAVRGWVGGLLALGSLHLLHCPTPALPCPAVPSCCAPPLPCPALAAAAQLPGLAQLAGSDAALNLGIIKPCSVLVSERARAWGLLLGAAVPAGAPDNPFSSPPADPPCSPLPLPPPPPAAAPHAPQCRRDCVCSGG